MLSRLGSSALNAARPPWTDVVGLARTLLALGTLGTLLASSTDTLFRPAFGLPPAPYCQGMGQLSLFCLIPKDRLEISRIAAMAILVVVASGWRPRVTALPHWWVSFSVAGSITIPDGGDQVTNVLTLLMLPIALTDRRPWHWSSSVETGTGYRTFIALSALTVIRLQVAGIYLHASLGKLAVPEWQDGTALFYWLSDPFFGPAPWLSAIVVPLAATSVGGILFGWGTIALEFVLAIALVVGERYRGPLLLAGIMFHVVIAVLMGLVSFGFAMCGALVLYLRPAHMPYGFTGAFLTVRTPRPALSGRPTSDRGPVTV